MSILSWCSRRAGGLSLLALSLLCACVLWSELKHATSSSSRAKGKPSQPLHGGGVASRDGGLVIIIFAYYSLFIHILVTIFPVRACWAIWDITKSLKNTTRSKKLNSPKARRTLSASSLSSTETLTPSLPSSSSSSDTEDVASGYYADGEVDQHHPIQAVLIPNYKEDIDVLRETLDVLASHPKARYQYDVSCPSDLPILPND